jgi:hypothetical protein
VARYHDTAAVRHRPADHQDICSELSSDRTYGFRGLSSGEPNVRLHSDVRYKITNLSSHNTRHVRRVFGVMYEADHRLELSVDMNDSE